LRYARSDFKTNPCPAFISRRAVRVYKRTFLGHCDLVIRAYGLETDTVRLFSYAERPAHDAELTSTYNYLHDVGARLNTAKYV
jgi:hypothetical protein